MKLIILIFLSILFPAEAQANFFNEINEGYERYREVIDYENSYYKIIIIQGINNDELTYGIFFYNHKPTTDPHRLVITTNGKEYRLKTNARSDIHAPAIKLNGDVEINIYDSFGRKRGKTLTVEAMDISEFMLYDDFHEGENMGVTLSKLTRNLPFMSLQLILLLVFVGIIVVFGAIILFLYLTKRGMFNERKRVENVFNFKEFAKTLYEDPKDEDEYTLSEDEYVEIKEPITVYERQRDYDDEEELVDIEKTLTAKGYRVDYKNLSENEKNEIMLELMKMRDFKEISQEQYQQEVIKLWSK